jgi:SAM-dependent MidA family methyltransferase
MHPSDLPRPDSSALAASRALLDRIASDLAAHGNWIPFARYMDIALYEPELGYYRGGNPLFGATGDFVTAPELSPLFARALARQVAELLEPGAAVLEFGAGSGALADELLRALAELGCGEPAYLILETSPGLRTRQRERLGTRARWITQLPQGFRGVMLANEVVDAMPVHALAWTRNGIFERGVCANEGELAWCERPAQGEALSSALAIDVALPPSGRYESELSLAARAWMRTVAESLERGALIVIDYGFPQHEYYHAQRSTGTLMCHYRHRAHGDPFYLPGLQDITAHVDFSALAHSTSDAGLEVLGYAGQAQFLVNCGITDLLAQVDASDVRRYAPLAAAANRLLSPAEMGELFKVLVVGRGVKHALTGFAQGDRAHAL